MWGGAGGEIEQESELKRLRNRKRELEEMLRLKKQERVVEEMKARENEKAVFEDALRSGVLTEEQVRVLARNIYDHEEIVNKLKSLLQKLNARGSGSTYQEGTAESVRNKLEEFEESLSLLKGYWDNAHRNSPVMKFKTHDYKSWIPNMF